MIKKIKSNYEKAKWFLINKPFSRDSDFQLISMWWYNEALKQNLCEDNFFLDFANKKYTAPEAITRARRKIQEQYPELRGKSYKGRKENEIEVRTQINK